MPALLEDAKGRMIRFIDGRWTGDGSLVSIANERLPLDSFPSWRRLSEYVKRVGILVGAVKVEISDDLKESPEV